MHMVGSRNSTVANGMICSLLLALALLFLGCDSKRAATLPSDLVGTWRTNHPKYQGLYFQLEKDRLAYSTASGSVENYEISKYEKLESGRKSKRSSHVVYARRDGQELKLALEYEPIDGGILRFKNQPQIPWTREERPAR